MQQPQDIQLRSATAGDADALARLVIGFRDFLKRSQPSEHEVRTSVNVWLGCSNTEISLAFKNGVAVGYATVLYQYSLWANGTGATVSDLFVLESGRKAGVGRQLIIHALEIAARRGARAANLSTNERNVASTQIYESLGFDSYSQVWQGRQVAYRKTLVAPSDV
jgi:GNAT superfamily N-acetyltransferase